MKSSLVKLDTLTIFIVERNFKRIFHLLLQMSDLNGAGDAGKGAVVEGKKPTDMKAELKTEMDPETMAKKIKRQIEVCVEMFNHNF